MCACREYTLRPVLVGEGSARGKPMKRRHMVLRFARPPAQIVQRMTAVLLTELQRRRTGLGRSGDGFSVDSHRVGRLCRWQVARHGGRNLTGMGVSGRVERGERLQVIEIYQLSEWNWQG